MSKENKVHHIEEEIVIPADHREDGSVKYHVCYGKVDWEKDGKNLKPAVFILMSYSGRINYQSPAHLTLGADSPNDFDRVLEALTYLKYKHQLMKKYDVNIKVNKPDF